MMDAKGLKKLREQRGWTQKDVAELLSLTFSRNYTAEGVSRWERGNRPVPKDIDVFLTELQLEGALPDRETLEEAAGLGDEPAPFPDDAPPGEDTVPTGPATPRRQEPIVGSSGIYARVCTEMWELVATGVGMVGAVTGSATLTADGRIIEADKEALGRAYGKLAETNETFRRMLTGMTTSGAWLEVALVTGITAGKVMRNHQPAALPRGAEEVPDDGDGRVIPFAQPAD